MDDYDFEKTDRETEEKIAKDIGLVWEHDRWVEPECIDQEAERSTVKDIGLFGDFNRWIELDIAVEIARMKRSIEIASFGKDATGPLSPNQNPQIELLDIRPEQFELVPIGSYGDENLPPNTTILDDSYIVYIQIPNPEYDCEVIIS